METLYGDYRDNLDHIPGRWPRALCRVFGHRPIRKGSWCRCRRCYVWTKDSWPTQRPRWWQQLRRAHG